MRTVRSFVRREGRATRAQLRALEELWPRYGIADLDALGDLTGVFMRQAPRLIEIGPGDGEHLASRALADPGCDFIGVEVYRPGVGRLLNQLAQMGLWNVRVVSADVSEVIGAFADASLSGVYILFPDPWPKKRHHKRRLLQLPFVAELRRVLRRGGRVNLVTDSADYADHARHTMDQSGAFTDAAEGRPMLRSRHRAPTRFERRALRDGRDIFEFVFVAT